MKSQVLACVSSSLAQLAEAEVTGRLPDKVIQDLVKTGFFDLVRPKQFGGQEAEFPDLIDIVVETASWNGSLAWFMMIMSQHNIVARLLPRSLCDMVFSSRPMLMASCAYPVGRAEPSGDTYILNGTWKYATGIHFSNWVLVDADIEGAPAGKGARFILPSSAFSVHDDWNAIGMRASGSNSISLIDHPVSATMRVESKLAHFSGRDAEIKVPRRYRIPGRLLTALGTTAPIIGLLVGMVRELSPKQSTRLTLEQVASRAELTGLFGRVRILHDAYFGMVKQVSDYTYKPELFTGAFQQDMVMRCARLSQQCRALASELFAQSGTKGAERSSAVAIKFADIHVMSTHYLMRPLVAEVNSVLMKNG